MHSRLAAERERYGWRDAVEDTEIGDGPAEDSGAPPVMPGASKTEPSRQLVLAEIRSHDVAGLIELSSELVVVVRADQK